MILERQEKFAKQAVDFWEKQLKEVTNDFLSDKKEFNIEEFSTEYLQIKNILKTLKDDYETIKNKKEEAGEEKNDDIINA